jgi:hypothetical protein
MLMGVAPSVYWFGRLLAQYPTSSAFITASASFGGNLIFVGLCFYYDKHRIVLEIGLHLSIYGRDSSEKICAEMQAKYFSSLIRKF